MKLMIALVVGVRYTPHRNELNQNIKQLDYFTIYLITSLNMTNTNTNSALFGM